MLAAGFMTYLSKTLPNPNIFVFLSLVGIYGGYTVISTKATSALLNLSFFKFFTYPISYLMLIILVSSAILQIWYLNEALARFDSVEVIPTQFVFFTLSAILGSAITYNDFGHMKPNAIIISTISVAIMFSGVYFITKRPSKSSNINSYLPVNDKDSMTLDDSTDHIKIPSDCIIAQSRHEPGRKISLTNLLESVSTRYPHFQPIEYSPETHLLPTSVIRPPPNHIQRYLYSEPNEPKSFYKSKQINVSGDTLN
jgi:hypothetical protein